MRKALLSWSLPFVLCIVLGCTPWLKETEPDNESLMRYLQAQDVYLQGRFADAADMLSEESKFTPALILKGKAEYLSGENEKAEKTLRRALLIKPYNTEALIFLARILNERGESIEAQKELDKILAENPMEIRALRLAAELALNRGVSGEAASAAFLDRAVEASMESAMIFLDRARLRWTGGNRMGAIEDLGRAKVLLPDDSPVMRAVVRLENIILEEF